MEKDKGESSKEEGSTPSKRSSENGALSSEGATEIKVEPKDEVNPSEEASGAKFKYKMGMKTEEEEDKTGWTKVDEISPSKDKAPGSDSTFKYTMGVKTEKEEDETGWNKVEDVSSSKDTAPGSDASFKYVMGRKSEKEEEENETGWQKVKEVNPFKNQLPPGNVSFLYRMGIKSAEELEAESNWTPVSEIVGSESEEELSPSQSSDQNEEQEERNKSEGISKGLDQVKLQDSEDLKHDGADDDNVFVQWAMNTESTPEFLRKKYSGLSVKKKKEVDKVLQKARIRRTSCPSDYVDVSLPSIAEKPLEQGCTESSKHNLAAHRGSGHYEEQATGEKRSPQVTSKINQNESERLGKRRKSWFAYLMSEKIEEAKKGDYYDPAMEQHRRHLQGQTSPAKEHKLIGRRHSHYDIIDGIPSPLQGKSGRRRSQDKVSYQRSHSEHDVPSPRQSLNHVDDGRLSKLDKASTRQSQDRQYH